MKNSILTGNATNVNAIKEGIILGNESPQDETPKQDETPTQKVNDDVLIKRGIAETLIECEEYTKGQASKMATIIFYDSKPELTIQETKYKANALMFFECKSLSKVFNELTKSKNAEVIALVKDIIGASTMPSFKAFSEKAKEGQRFFSLWDGFNILAKFNKKAQLKKRVERQNKSTAKK